MDTSSLKYFMTVARLQHMTRAAELLNITQPSLSASIRRLENEIGYTLFDRTKGGIRLNEYGLLFYQGLLEASAAMSSRMSEMEDLKKSSTNQVRLSCSNSPINSRLIGLMLSDGINLKVSDISHHWEQDLLDRSCDMVITMGLSHAPKISSTRLALQRLVFVVGKDHPLSKAGLLSVKDLLPYSFCSTDAPHSLLNVTLKQCPLEDFHPHIAFWGRNSADMLKAIRSGRFIGLMVERNLAETDDICILQLSDLLISLPIFLYWRESGRRDPAFLSVRENIESFYRSLS